MRAMAIDAPSHGEGRNLCHSVHRFNGPMTPLAGDGGKNMLAVVEIDEVWELVDPDPGNWAPLYKGLLQFFNLGGLTLQNVVTIHADTLRRYTRIAAFSGAKVAVQARHFVLPGMDLMREGNRLNRSVPLMDSDTREPPRSQCNTAAETENTQADKHAPHGQLFSVFFILQDPQYRVVRPPPQHDRSPLRFRPGSERTHNSVEHSSENDHQ